MPTVSNKHRNAQQVFYSAFDGGLNLSVPPESLAKNELKEAINVEFSPNTGAMTVRGGMVWSGRFDSEIDCVVEVPGRHGFLVRRKGKKTLQYFKWNYIWPVAGELTGNGEISIVAWDGYFLIASGGKLQKFIDDDTPKLETISGSPSNCRIVLVRDGRVGVVDGDDTLRFSSVGDCEDWVHNPLDESTAQYIEVGYKDGMNITALMQLSRDLMVFKAPEGEPDKGTIFRLTGEMANFTWAVLEVAHNAGTFSQKSVQAVANDVYYITVSGVASLSAVTSYGEIKAQWPDRKVSSALIPLIDETAELWNVPVKQQLWVLPSKDAREIWILDYTRGIWTKFQFPKAIIHAAGVDNALYVFTNRDLYRVEDGYLVDELKDEGKQEIEAFMRMGTLLMGKQILVKGVFASFGLLPGTRAELWLGKFCMRFSGGGAIDYIYDAPNDTQKASEDNDPLYPTGGTLTSRRQCIVRDWAITPEVKIYGGGCSLSTMGLETAEV
ncbi:MAG: hypothetical protein IJM68_00585 [Synergistaceae bacterium]|nr:hypothetical protein [Synergistaceae bacterium]